MCNCGNRGKCMKYVWVPYKLDELKGRRGLFMVETKLADELLEKGLVEDPAHGANKFTRITDEPAPRKEPRKTKSKKADKSLEVNEDKAIDADDLDVAAD